jgi:hypothetical protein
VSQAERFVTESRGQHSKPQAKERQEGRHALGAMSANAANVVRTSK